jgi:hypothetical protein
MKNINRGLKMEIKKEIGQVDYEGLKRELEEFLGENRDAVLGKYFKVYMKYNCLMLKEDIIKDAELLGYFFYYNDGCGNGYAIFTGTNEFYGVTFEFLLRGAD